MPGFIEEADLPLWYASAHALVFPSLIEGFGLPSRRLWLVAYQWRLQSEAV